MKYEVSLYFVTCYIYINGEAMGLKRIGYHFVLVEGSLVPKEFGSVPGLNEMSYVEA